MARRPVVGADEGVWGTIDNEWCLVEHNANGSHDDDTFMQTLASKMVCVDDGIVVDKANKTGPIPSGSTFIYV